MKLEIGKCYQVIKNDETTMTFQFVGNSKYVVNGVSIILFEDGIKKEEDLYHVLKGGYVAYWEIECK